MTVEERLDRIEHITAGLAEERRKDREEYKMLWRESQRQIDELTKKIADTNQAVVRLADETSAGMRELRAGIDELRQETAAADRRLGERIDALVSAMGEFLRQVNPPR
jgi:hypothetical protein